METKSGTRVRVTTDDPHNNFDMMTNMLYPKEGEVYVRGSGEHGRGDESLLIVALKSCLLGNCPGVSDVIDERDDGIYAAEDITLEAFDEKMYECSADGCPIAMLYNACAGACHLRDELKRREDEEGLKLTIGENMLVLAKAAAHKDK